MRILLSTHEFHPIKAGAGNYTASLAAGLSELGHDVTVMAPHYGVETGAWDAEQPYHVLRARFPRESKAGYVLASFHLLDCYRRMKPDFFLITEADAQIPVALARFLVPLDYSAIIHGSEIRWYLGAPETIKSKLLSAIMIRFYPKATCIICGSSAIAGDLLQRLPVLAERVAIVRYGIDLMKINGLSTQKIENYRRELNLNGPVVLTVGRLIPEKGQDTVLKALSRIVLEMPQLKYVVVGTGGYRAQLESLANELSLRENVVFTDKISDDALRIYYSLCDLFIMPSRPGTRVEGFGLVFAEAAAYNKPVVGGDTGGVAEFVQDGYNGFLVDPFNIDDVEKAIRTLLVNQELARMMGMNGRKMVECEFNSKVMAEKTLEAVKSKRAKQRSSTMLRDQNAPKSHG